jgi:DNA-binding winged helix-turn-helix (wHTH) protein
VELAFGPFRLSLSRRLLVRVTDQGEQPVSLGSRALNILIQLVRRPGTLVTKDDLMDAVWPGVAVEDNNLTVQMAALRRALGDGQGGARWIETVPGRGYRFVAAVSEVIEPLSGRAFEPAEEPAPAVASRSTRVIRCAVTVLTLVAVTFAGVLVAGRFNGQAALDNRPALSIVVLPFAWVDANADQAYIAEAITDDLTTRSSRPAGQPAPGRATRRAIPT